MCLPSNGKREHFSETTVDSRLLVSRADKLRGTRKPRVQPVSPLVASRIGHPSSKLGPRLLLDTATRCGEEGKRETSLREEATSHRGLFTREFNLCALLYSNEQVCRVQSRSTKKTSNVVPAIPLRRYIYSPLSKSVLSRPRICGGDRLEDGAVPIFSSQLLFFTDIRSDSVQFRVQWKYFYICLILKKRILNQFFSNRK